MLGEPRWKKLPLMTEKEEFLACFFPLIAVTGEQHTMKTT